MKRIVLGAACLSLSAALAPQVLAQTDEVRPQPAAAQALDPQFARFAPAANTSNTHLDYAVWDEALNYFVMGMGYSIREGAPRPSPGMGTRIIYGHDSRFRLEGNRVVFSFLDDKIIATLTEYREDLERIADKVDIQALSSDEQLAYWINLHNVAVIEQIALAYPVHSPSRMELGPNHLPLDEAKFITVSGVKMSPKDIRTKIVFPNWNDPKVIYGFFRGEIGGPSIQRQAFTADNVERLLAHSAIEFVNSLRGTEERGDTLFVSKIYEEAIPFFFASGDAALKSHLRTYASDDVDALIDETSGVRTALYSEDIADLAKGEFAPSYHDVIVNADSESQHTQGFRIAANIQRLLTERSHKIEKLRRRGLIGQVIVLPGSPGEAGAADPDGTQGATEQQSDTSRPEGPAAT